MSFTAWIEWEKTLTIQNVSESDEGTYTCRITDLHNNTNSDSKYVKIYSEYDTFINLTVHSEKIEVDATLEDVAKWIVTLSAHPNARLTWLNPNGTNISEIYQNSDKYRIRTKGSNKILEIFDVSVSDSGNYTVIAENYKHKAVLNLQLVVLNKPEIQTIRVHEFYQINVPRNLSCVVVGYPPARIQWKFKKCNFITDEDCVRNKFEPISVSIDKFMAKTLGSLVLLLIGTVHC